MAHFRRGEHDPLATHGAHRAVEYDGQQDPSHRRLQGAIPTNL